MRYNYIYRGNTEDYEQMYGRAALDDYTDKNMLVEGFD